VALAIAGLVWSVSLSQKLGRTQEEMARRSADTQAEAAAARLVASQAEALSKDLLARLGVAELRLSEVSLQRTQLEELMLSVSRSRDDSLVQDMESTLRLALQQSQLTGSAQPLISALQGAEQRIERAAQPRLNPVQRAIGRDIERLRAAQLVDVPALVSRIDELIRQVDEWPLRNAPLVASALKPEGDQPPEAPDKALAESNPPEATEPPAEIDSRSLLQRQWEAFGAWRSQTASRWWQQFREGTSDLIRVSRIDQPEAALLAPEQSYLLRENIKLKLLNARLGLLGRQLDTAKADVDTTRQLVQRFFDDAAPSTRLALQSLTQLHQDMRQDMLPRPDETLAALAVAASGR
jgi:uroporphyrin-3 C-methyltransferase